ncbi:hypothetical protein ACFXAZ_25625, partial [Streptomyces sp. NPDC059477]
ATPASGRGGAAGAGAADAATAATERGAATGARADVAGAAEAPTTTAPTTTAPTATATGAGAADTAATDADGGAAAGGGPVGRAFARSGGNPFMFLELLRHTGGPDAVPPAVARLVAAKQAAVGPDAARLLQAAAVCGPRVSFDVVAGAAGLDVLAALDALEALLRARFLTEVTAGGLGHPGRAAVYEFCHDVVRQAVGEQVSDARRRHVTSRQQMVPAPRQESGHQLARTGGERTRQLSRPA